MFWFSVYLSGGGDDGLQGGGGAGRVARVTAGVLRGVVVVFSIGGGVLQQVPPALGALGVVRGRGGGRGAQDRSHPAVRENNTVRDTHCTRSRQQRQRRLGIFWNFVAKRL